jgi:formamidopyrimidine-DNA glycosylase
MPELPEVEVTRRQVERVLLGSTVLSVWTSQPSYFFVTEPGLLKKRMRGRVARELSRHGKYIVATFDDDSRLLLHLGMTGQLSVHDFPRDPHVHLRLQLSDGKGLFFRDVRKFGKVEWLAPGQSSRRLDKLGPDALTVTLAPFHTRLAARKIPIKQALLDQSILAGVGNIYADEALFAARILPERKSHTLNLAEARRLLSEVKRVLNKSILHGGSTINDYLQPDGELGGYQNWHRVYGRTAEPCPRCRTPISRVVLGGRSSHYCSVCQT